MVAPFIMKHLDLRFGPGSRLAFGEDGNLVAEFNWRVQYDVCPTWLTLAIDHAKRATEHRIRRIEAWAGTSDELKAQTLLDEFQSSLQAVVAAATALEATYSAVLPLVQIPVMTRQSWQKNRTPRYAQVAEVLRRGFSLGNKHTKGIHANVREIYRLRDSAVHPTAELRPLVWHSEMKVPVEWQFDTYRARNTELIVAGVGQLLWQLSHHASIRNPRVQAFAVNMKLYLAELFPDGCPALPTAE